MKFMNTTLISESESGEVSMEIAKLGLAPGEILLGTVSGIDVNGSPVVTFTYVDDSVSAIAISTVAVNHQHIGRQVALLFANGDYQKPVITGFIYSPLHQLLENFEFKSDTSEPDEFGDQQVFDIVNIHPELKKERDLSSASETVKVDGKKILIEGQEEVVLKCGESSITLTKAGKIVIRGKYLLSRAAGINRILGGAVQVN